MDISQRWLPWDILFKFGLVFETIFEISLSYIAIALPLQCVILLKSLRRAAEISLEKLYIRYYVYLFIQVLQRLKLHKLRNI